MSVHLCVKRLMLCVAALLSAVPAALGVNLAAHGVLVQVDRGNPCLRFETDSGQLFFLNNFAGLTAGDRLYVEGTYDSTGFVVICGNELTPLVTTTTVKPAFAGVGTLTRVGRSIQLRTDDGRFYQVQSRGLNGENARVYIQGAVNTAVTPPMIMNTLSTIGPAYAGFGRYVSTTPGAAIVRGEDGVLYSLDRVGDYFAQPYDYVYVEGILGGSRTTRTVSAATARRAFNTTGNIVQNGPALGFKADGVVFNDVFSAAGLSSFALGAKVYVRGQATDDYDYNEPKVANAIRQARVGPGYVAFGIIDGTNKRLVNEDDMTVVQLENTAGAPDGAYAYVGGLVASSSPGNVTLGHNVATPAVFAEGTVNFGYECSPLFITTTGGVFFLENVQPWQNNDFIRVRGGYSLTAAPCDFECLINNSYQFLGGGGLPEE